MRFHGLGHPTQMAESEINAFLKHLLINRKVNASTQNQALCALLFLYRHIRVVLPALFRVWRQ
ncbi:MAG: phage integrase N-terminal SAM-like domain-containing protein [Actinobacteria bacterium]|nr:phage integrase N-terminal SAM-like domain-containing protein [Actinomycetota bacterium]MCL6093762.1 phage integrase N-terminal SAM-like domain-containing protein [Actinomycetota bacterium]